VKLSRRIRAQLSAADHHLRALTRSWRGRFILAFVALQLALPLLYYVARRDPHDERFAWRMFSPMRMAQCSPRFEIDGRPVNLYSRFHEAWVTTAQRGRFDVIEAMGAVLCREHPGKAVNVWLSCTYIDRDPTTWGGHDLCASPRL